MIVGTLWQICVFQRGTMSFNVAPMFLQVHVEDMFFVQKMLVLLRCGQRNAV